MKTHHLNNHKKGRTAASFFSIAQLIWLVAMVGGSLLFGFFINKCQADELSNKHQIPISYHYRASAKY